jgi:hypothetical protein
MFFTVEVHPQVTPPFLAEANDPHQHEQHCR